MYRRQPIAGRCYCPLVPRTGLWCCHVMSRDTLCYGVLLLLNHFLVRALNTPSDSDTPCHRGTLHKVHTNHRSLNPLTAIPTSRVPLSVIAEPRYTRSPVWWCYRLMSTMGVKGSSAASCTALHRALRHQAQWHVGREAKESLILF